LGFLQWFANPNGVRPYQIDLEILEFCFGDDLIGEVTETCVDSIHNSISFFDNILNDLAASGNLLP
jgi:hypothetical protein